MATSEVFVKLDQAQVKDAVDASVRLAVTEALGRNADAMVRAVVDAALAAPSGSYGKSAFRESLDKAIRQEAQGAVDDLLAAERPRIRAAIRERITAERLVDRVVDNVLSNPAGLYVDVRVMEPTQSDD